MKPLLKFFLLLSLFLVFNCCEKEEADDERTPKASVNATLNLRDSEGNSVTNPWSLPDVSATRRNGDIIITGYNSGSGEVLTMRVPDDGAQYYSNTSANNNQGYGSWQSSNSSETWYSNIFPEGSLGDYVVDIAAIDEANNTMTGTFFMAVYSPLSGEKAFFQNGSFTNVPIVVSQEDDEITENKLSFKVSGINFNPTAIKVTKDSTETILTIEASNSGASIVMISIPLSALDQDKFPVGPADDAIQVSYQKPSFDAFPGLNGNLIIDTHNQGAQTMSGSFEFQVGEFGTPNHTITEGEFEILY